MSTEPITPSSIDTISFRIPLYQRPYEWEDSQVLQLLKDLYEAFKKTPNSHYYIGILSVAETSDDKACYDLIDGQQRITALVLIGKTVCKYYREWAKFCDDRLHLYGRMGDQNYLGDDDQDKRNPDNPKMAATVTLAASFFKNLGDTAASFAEYIYNHAAFFLAEVPSSYSLLDKNQQFVRMNNRGKQLEKHEILKVQLIPKISESIARDNAFVVWNDMVSCLTGAGAEQESTCKDLKSILSENVSDSKISSKEAFYNSIVSIPEFLLIALARCRGINENTEISHKTDKLIETFRKELLTGDEAIIASSIGKFVDVLKTQLAILKAFFIFIRTGGAYELGWTDNEEESSFDFGDESKDEKNRLITMQSFLYVSSTEPHQWLIPAFNWCQQFINTRVGAMAFIEKLEAIDNGLIQKRSLTSIFRLEDMVYSSVSHYWFYRLDYELWKLFEEKHSEKIWAKLSGDEPVKKLLQSFRFRPCGSVEHIVPQHPVGAVSRTEPDHSFGNLALISGSRNSKFGNLGIDGKKEQVLGSGYTESLKMIHFLWCNPDARSSGQAMHNILLEAVNGHLPIGT